MNTNLISFRTAAAAAACALTLASASAQVTIADSQADFSSTQGQGNWSYGYYTGAAPLGPSNFAPFPAFVGIAPAGQWERTPSAYIGGLGYFTALSAAGGHPHAIAGSVNETNWAVRRWTSPIAGTITLAGAVRKTSNFFSGVQDGSVARILVGNTEVFNLDLAATDISNHTFSIPTCVSVGTTIDFAIDPKANEFSDGFEFSSTIRTSAPTVIDGPLSNLSCPSGITAFGIDTIGGLGSAPLTFQWQIQTAPNVWENLGANFVNIPCPQGSGGTPGVASAGQSTTSTLLLRVRPCTGGTVNAGEPTRYQIRCIVSDGCQSTTSPEATFTVCPADFNCSGAVSVQDIFDFLTAWFNGDASANFNLTGGVTVQDVFDLLSAWFAGCSQM